MDLLLSASPRREQLCAMTTWARNERTQATLELFLDDRIEHLPTYESISGRPPQPHIALESRECVFQYNDGLGPFNYYEMRAKLGLDGGRSWYGFSLQFSASDYPRIEIFQIDRIILKGTHRQVNGKNMYHEMKRPVSSELYSRLLWVGDRLFWSLDSMSGNTLCKDMEHTPTHLHDSWYHEVMSPYLPDVYVNLLPLDRRERAVNTS